MRRSFVLILPLLFLVACNDENVSKISNARPPAMHPSMAVRKFAAGGAPNYAQMGEAASAYKLAFDHTIQVEMPRTSIEPRFIKLRDLCLSSEKLRCLLQQASLSRETEEDGTYETYSRQQLATLQVRLPHDAVKSFEEAMVEPLPGEQADDLNVTRRDTTVHDLSNEIADQERRLKQLTDFRQSLETLAKRPDAEVDDLIRIHQQLSQTQSQIEQLTSQNNRTNERVATEALTISFVQRPDVKGSFQPVSFIWHRAGVLLGDNAADALRFCIGAIPWLPVLAFGGFLARLGLKLWKRKTAGQTAK